MVNSMLCVFNNNKKEKTKLTVMNGSCSHSPQSDNSEDILWK